MQIPNLIQNFIRKRIVSECILLPFFYPDEFESFQDGYRFNRITGEDLTGSAPGQWRKSWQVIARNGMDDPFFVDFALGDASPVYFAYHGAGSWKPIKVADDIVKFEEILTALAVLKKPCSLDAIAPLADLNNEFYRELADDYAQANEEVEEKTTNISAFSSRI